MRADAPGCPRENFIHVSGYVIATSLRRGLQKFREILKSQGNPNETHDFTIISGFFLVSHLAISQMFLC